MAAATGVHNSEVTVYYYESRKAFEDKVVGVACSVFLIMRGEEQLYLFSFFSLYDEKLKLIVFSNKDIETIHLETIGGKTLFRAVEI
jgi:hypothetical protein